MERPSVSNTKDKPNLYDGEKILLTGIDRALLHAQQTAQRLSIQRDEMVTQAASKERARANYLSALRKLADKRRRKCLATKAFTVPSSKRSQQQNQLVGSSKVRWSEPKPITSSNTTLRMNTTCNKTPRIYPPATKVFPASPQMAFKASKKSKNAGKQYTPREHQRSEMDFDGNSIPSMGGSSLDFKIAQMPIGDEELIEPKAGSSTSQLQMPQGKALDLVKNTIDPLFKHSPVEVDGLMSDVLRCESKKTKGKKKTNVDHSPRKSKRAAAIAGAVYTEEFPSDVDV